MRREERRGVCACPVLLLLCAGIDIKVKTTFFGLFLWFFFGTFSLSAPWVVCHVRLSEVREWRGGEGDCVGIYLGGFYINLNYFVFPALKLKLAAVPRITGLFISPLTHTQRISLSLSLFSFLQSATVASSITCARSAIVRAARWSSTMPSPTSSK